MQFCFSKSKLQHYELAEIGQGLEMKNLCLREKGTNIYHRQSSQTLVPFEDTVRGHWFLRNGTNTSFNSDIN